MKKKTVVNAYFLNADSELFKKNVRKLLPDGVDSIDIFSVWFHKGKGYGSYFFSIECSINGDAKDMKLHTNDSVAYDNYTDYEDGSRILENWQKRTVLKILSDEVVLTELDEFLNTQKND